MKHSRKNDFDPDELASWFIFNAACWWCGRSHANCFHHITGRNGAYRNSILNAAPLNNHECHLPNHGRIRDFKVRTQFLQKTLAYLLSQGYQFSDRDRGFIERHLAEYRSIAGAGMRKPNELPETATGSEPLRRESLAGSEEVAGRLEGGSSMEIA